MKIIYVSSLCSKRTYKNLFGGTKYAPGMQAQKYNRLMAEGIAANDGSDVTVLSAAPVTRANHGGLSFSAGSEKEGGLLYDYVNFSLFPIIKHLSIIRNTQKKCRKVFKESDCKDIAIVCDILSLSASYGALKAAKKCNIKSVSLITDLPEYLGIADNKLFNKLLISVIKLRAKVLVG